MGITHVVRGDDHLSNTPRQLLVLSALGADAAALRAPAAAARHRRQAAVQAPRRRLRAGAARRRLPPGGGAQLPRAARLGLRRGDDLLHHRGADREVLARAGVPLAGRLRRAEAVLDERALHPRAGPGRARRAAPPSTWRARGFPGADDPRLEQAVAAVQDKVSTLAEIPAPGRLRVRPDRDRPGGLGQGDGQGRRAGGAGQRAREALAAVEPFDEQHVEQALRARGGGARE